MSMQDVIVQGRARVTPRRIWAIWIDVAAAPTWDAGLDWSRVDGPFQVGGRGEFKLKGGPCLRFMLEEVVREKLYASAVRVLPGLTLRFTHELYPQNGGGVLVRHGVEIGGALGRLLRPLLRRMLKPALQKALDNMLRLAEGAQQCADAEGRLLA